MFFSANLFEYKLVIVFLNIHRFVAADRSRKDNDNTDVAANGGLLNQIQNLERTDGTRRSILVVEQDTATTTIVTMLIEFR